MVVTVFPRYFAFCLLLIVTVSSLTLHPVTTKPKQPKHPTTTGGGNANKTTSEYVLYRFTKDGATCILFKADGLIEVRFKSPIGDDKDDVYFSDEAKITGDCKEDTSVLNIEWSGYSLQFSFEKTPGAERWYVDKIDLVVSSDIDRYHEIRNKLGKTFRLTNTANLYATPVGKSYSCEKETTVDLRMPEEESNPTQLRGTLFLRKFQVQPFMYKDANFGPSFDCNAPAAFRDETAPIAVGSTLAVAVLATIIGYAVYRHFKIKKVQYNTME